MPAYNAAATVAGVVSRLPIDRLVAKSAVESGRRFRSVRLYAVDDGSTDGTGEVLREIGRQGWIAVTVLTHAFNRGYGAAIKTGLTAALRDMHAPLGSEVVGPERAAVGDGTDVLVVLHSDGQYAPEELEDVVAPLCSGQADVVIGSKFLKGEAVRQGMPVSRFLGIAILDRLANLLFRTRGLEFHSGYMAYTSEALSRIRFRHLTDGFHFDGEMVVSAARAGLRIVRVPISTNYSAGVSSLKPAPYLLDVLRTMVRFGLRARSGKNV